MTRLLIIIPVEILDAVRAAAAQAFGDVAKAAFVPAGSPTGDEPATHWWLSGVFSAEEQALLPDLQAAFPAAHVESYDMKAEAGRPWALLGEMGMKPLTVEVPG